MTWNPVGGMSTFDTSLIKFSKRRNSYENTLQFYSRTGFFHNSATYVQKTVRQSLPNNIVLSVSTITSEPNGTYLSHTPDFRQASVINEIDTDFTKVFDKINHSILVLLPKLHNISF